MNLSALNQKILVAHIEKLNKVEEFQDMYGQLPGSYIEEHAYMDGIEEAICDDLSIPLPEELKK